MSYLEDPGPGRGSLPPRAAFTSDAPALSLNGTWRFRLSPSLAAAPAGVEGDEFDDSAWDELAVPSLWQLHGHGRPAYTNVRYPFPVDPPHVPSDNPTGDHRLRFDLPPDWPAGSAVLRFDGIDSCGRIWLNGTELGITQGSRLPSEFEVGPLLRPGGNVLVVRVHQWSAGSYLEDQDMWWLSGIFRAVTLLARPDGGIGDYWVRADYDHTTGLGTVRVETGQDVVLDLPELGVVGHPAGEPLELPVEPWSAETPRLYEGTLSTAAEQVRVRIGFRTITISEGQLQVNGRRLLLRGVNRHEHDPRTGRVVSPETALADVLLMKRHNVNAVRTSHYPPDPAFLELCDTHGLWVIDECDLETHGFEPLGWAGNPSGDPRWAEAYLDRMRRTVERDKNRPSVILWSLGNESHTGDNLARMAEWVRRPRPDPADPLRGRSRLRLRGRPQPDVRHPRRGRADRPPGRRQRAPPGPAVPAVRVRARDGQRPGWPAGVPRAVRAVPELPGRVHLGVDRPRPRRRRATSPTAATSANRSTTATSSSTGWSSRTGRRHRGWSSTRRSSSRSGSTRTRPGSG